MTRFLLGLALGAFLATMATLHSVWWQSGAGE